MTISEADFGRRVGHLLNAQLQHIPADSRARLGAARRLALSRKKQTVMARVLARIPALQLQGFGTSMSQPATNRLWLMLALTALVLGLNMLYDTALHRHIHETAEIDAMVLSDELPLTAYVDEGFNSYLDLQEDEK